MRRLLAIAAFALPACSLFTSLGDYSNDEAAGGDATPEGTTTSDGGSGSDGTPASDASQADASADADAGFPNLHPNGEFEFSCQGWYPYNATLEGDTVAHTGMGSCRVCADKTVNDTATIDEFGGAGAPVTGGVYYAAAWFRIADGKPPPPSGVRLVFGTRDNGAPIEEVLSSPLAIDTTWKKLEVQLKVTKDAMHLRVYAGGTAQLGTCFLIDDVRVERRQ